MPFKSDEGNRFWYQLTARVLITISE